MAETHQEPIPGAGLWGRTGCGGGWVVSKQHWGFAPEEEGVCCRGEETCSRSSSLSEEEPSPKVRRGVLPCLFSIHLYFPHSVEQRIEAPIVHPRPAPLFHWGPVCNKVILYVPVIRGLITYGVRCCYYPHFTGKKQRGTELIRSLSEVTQPESGGAGI